MALSQVKKISDIPESSASVSPAAANPAEYKIILPCFSAYLDFSQVAILHADIKGRPYSCADFKLALRPVIDFRW